MDLNKDMITAQQRASPLLPSSNLSRAWKFVLSKNVLSVMLLSPENPIDEYKTQDKVCNVA